MQLKQILSLRNYETDKFTSHQYLETYDTLFSGRTNSIKNVLEIGIQKGESLLVWKQLFPTAEIYGADINLAPLTIDKDQDRIHIFEGNAYDLNFIKHFSNIKFDLIIDDGPHTLDSMLFFAKHYSALLAADGIMIVEDIPVLDWTNSIKKSLPAFLQAKAKTIDLRPINNRWDDILLIVQ